MPEPVADLIRALAILSPNQRAAIALREYADLSTHDVARILGCSQATVGCISRKRGSACVRSWRRPMTDFHDRFRSLDDLGCS